MNRRPPLILLTALLPCAASAQMPTHTAPTPAPATHTFHDPTYHLSFDYPADWNFSHTDREISTFRLDARSAPKRTLMRAVVAMPENPFPMSTFSGAYLYFSVTPHASETSCVRQASSIAPQTASTPKPATANINDIPFTHGHDEQHHICITDHDEMYTTFRRGACYRFDLAINDFCSAASGVRDITPAQLDQVRSRLESILSTIRFDPK